MSDNSESKTNESGKARKSVVKKGKSTVAKKQMASDSLIISIDDWMTTRRRPVVQLRGL
ncbi:hypothetical protein FSP39_020242 [Pinctada imbricata]|uniref:Uncharacterized protein n=1 Tax=Pinctada imbricata TaxID=66713 RepID=A0AA88XP55_PINIB|nr:hypothetical protein FSP39_020242 [Pinctada imbricata]